MTNAKSDAESPTESPTESAALNHNWWRGAVIYQIYPRSFQDSNADGIGDLKGIAHRLEHVARLGADAIWVSPFFTSPMKDFGYDVSDYLDIDPIFGDLDAFDEMIATAHRLGIKVIIDLVLSHTSDQHPWFVESAQDKNNDKQDWYVWADAKPDGTPPNNWLSIFGGPAWTWNTARRQYFLHNFLSSQPDLNFHNEAVQDALLSVARFWLERGVDGFRLDTINFYFCDQQLRDNPAVDPTLRNADLASDVNPYSFQSHQFDKSRPENIAFLERLRGVMDEFPATTTIGEIGDAERSMELLSAYTMGNKRMHMCYTFDLLSETLLTAERLATILNEFENNGEDSWVCWAFSNHDVIRHVSRWALSDAQIKLFACILMSIRGSVCLYQGEELGLPEADIPFDQLQDPYGIAFWPDYKGRDGCRSPMVWEQKAAYAGFSSATPWLPISNEHKALSVDSQVGIANSFFEHYQQFIAFRKQWQPLVEGDYESINTDGNVITFIRRFQNQRLLCAFNMGDSTAELNLPEGCAYHLIDNALYAASISDASLRLDAYSAAFVQLS